jgi:hypothetical protein
VLFLQVHELLEEFVELAVGNDGSVIDVVEMVVVVDLLTQFGRAFGGCRFGHGKPQWGLW